MNNAQQMAKLGFTVFPLAGKKPAIKEWQNTKYGEYTPDGNYGVLLDGWTVVDFDPRNFRPGDPNPDEDFVWYVIQKTRDELGIDDTTFEVYSGRGDGGLHLYYKGETVTSKPGPGIDIKSGHGQYMVGPGSIHPESGEPYVLAGHSLTAPRELPEATQELVAARHAIVSAESPGSGLTDDGITEGNRNDGLFRHLAKMWGQVPMTEHELTRYAGVVNELDVTPPLEGYEVDRIVEQVLKYPAAVMNSMLGPSPFMPADFDPDQPFKLLSRADIEKLPKPGWCVDHLVPEHGVGQIFGPSYAGKSFIALDIAHRVAGGMDWIDREIVKPGPVVYVAMEGGFDLGARVNAWYALNKVSEDLPVSFLVESMIFDLTDMTRVSEFAKEVKASVGQPSMLFLDTQSLVAVGIEENDNTAMAALMRRAKELSIELGTFVWLVHHTGKKMRSDETQGRGASSQYAAMDVVLKVSPASKTESRSVEATKIKAARLPEHPWSFTLTDVDDSVAVTYIAREQAEKITEKALVDTPAIRGRNLAAWQILYGAKSLMSKRSVFEEMLHHWEGEKPLTLKMVDNTMTNLVRIGWAEARSTGPSGESLYAAVRATDEGAPDGDDYDE